MSRCDTPAASLCLWNETCACGPRRVIGTFACALGTYSATVCPFLWSVTVNAFFFLETCSWNACLWLENDFLSAYFSLVIYFSIFCFYLGTCSLIVYFSLPTGSWIACSFLWTGSWIFCLLQVIDSLISYLS